MNSNDKNNKRPTSRETRASQRRPQAETRRPKSNSTPSTRKPTPTKQVNENRPSRPVQNRKKKDSSSYKYLYITAIIAMIMFIAFFAIIQIKYFALNAEQEITERTNQLNNKDEVITQLELENAYNYLEMTGIVKEVKKNSIVFYDINTGEDIEIFIESKTPITDAYNKKIILLEIDTGDGFLVTYHKDTKIAKLIEVADDYYEHKNITGVVIDETSPIAHVKGREYYYDANTLAFSNGEVISIESINPKDTVTLKVIGNSLYYIAIEKEHGGLNILNGSHIENGTIEVDTDTIYYLKDISTISLTEGPHRIVIKGSNIEPYIYDFIISDSEYTTLDLSVVEERTSNLYINLNVEDATVTINNEVYEEYLSNDVITLPYGTYTFKVEKENYQPFESNIVVNSITETVNVDLVEIKLDSLIHINTTPEGATVYINNEYAGETPIEKSVDYGTYNVTLSLDGYKQISFTIDAVDSIHKYNVGLQKDE